MSIEQNDGRAGIFEASRSQARVVAGDQRFTQEARKSAKQMLKLPETGDENPQQSALPSAPDALPPTPTTDA